ncbi:MAG: hypothetical protein KDK70_32995, partial [Myxococcales bacterium]|nr:hypothetical protein [Myxococcales bacterium]
MPTTPTATENRPATAAAAVAVPPPAQPTSAEPDASAPAAVLVVRYRHATGILLDGETYPHKDAIKKAQPRWRWFRSIRRWGVPRTRDRALSRDEVERYAQGLTTAGMPGVRVDYAAPESTEATEGAARGEPSA